MSMRVRMKIMHLDGYDNGDDDNDEMTRMVML